MPDVRMMVFTFAHAYVYWDNIGDNRIDTA